MKRFILLVLAGLGLPGLIYAQGTIGHQQLFPVNFESISSPSSTNQPSGYGFFSDSQIFHLPGQTNFFEISINLGPSPATNGWLLEEAGRQLTPLTELSEQTNAVLIPPLPYLPYSGTELEYLYSGSFLPTTNQILSLWQGKMYVEVDYPDGQYLGNLVPAPQAIQSPQPNITISSETQFLYTGDIIAPNNQTATVVLDGSASTDPNYLPLQFAWLDGAAFLGDAGVVTNVLTVGTHEISLFIDDGVASNSVSSTVHVVTPAQAVRDLAEFVAQANLTRNQTALLDSPLSQAISAFNHYDMVMAENGLRTFQSQLNFQVARANPAAAAQLNEIAADIINVIEASRRPRF